jgi:tetratricopeptide (TPR) repeat protein
MIPDYYLFPKPEGILAQQADYREQRKILKSGVKSAIEDHVDSIAERLDQQQPSATSVFNSLTAHTNDIREALHMLISDVWSVGLKLVDIDSTLVWGFNGVMQELVALNVSLTDIKELLKQPDRIKDAHQHLRAGLKFYKQSLFQDAIEEFAATLDLQPKDYIAHFYLGMLFYRIRQDSVALDHLDKAGKYAKADSDEALGDVAVTTTLFGINPLIVVEQDSGHQAEETQGKGILRFIEAESQFYKGLCHYRLGHYDDSVDAFTYCDQMFPESMKYTLNLSRAQCSAKRYDESFDSFSRLLDKHPVVWMEALVAPFLQSHDFQDRLQRLERQMQANAKECLAALSNTPQLLSVLNSAWSPKLEKLFKDGTYLRFRAVVQIASEELRFERLSYHR